MIEITAHIICHTSRGYVSPVYELVNNNGKLYWKNKTGSQAIPSEWDMIFPFQDLEQFRLALIKQNDSPFILRVIELTKRKWAPNRIPFRQKDILNMIRLTDWSPNNVK